MTPASYWKQVREAETKATPGPWSDGNYPDITTGDGCTAVLDSNMGFMLADDAEFIAIARTALPLALDEIDRLEKVGNDLSHEVNDAYERGVREGAATVRGWSKSRIEELEAALFIAQQMSNCVYNAMQNDENWERAKKALAELLPQFDAAMGKS